MFFLLFMLFLICDPCGSVYTVILFSECKGTAFFQSTKQKQRNFQEKAEKICFALFLPILGRFRPSLARSHGSKHRDHHRPSFTPSDGSPPPAAGTQSGGPPSPAVSDERPGREPRGGHRWKAGGGHISIGAHTLGDAQTASVWRPVSDLFMACLFS